MQLNDSGDINHISSRGNGSSSPRWNSTENIVYVKSIKQIRAILEDSVIAKQ